MAAQRIFGQAPKLRPNSCHPVTLQRRSFKKVPQRYDAMNFEKNDATAFGRDALSPGQEAHDASVGAGKGGLPALSEQQEQVKQALIEGRQNILINACAGSGKTTTVLQMAVHVQKRFLVLLYNQRLRIETIERVPLGLTNLTIDNYHGLGYRYYTREADTDQGLKRIVEDDLPPLKPLPKFDVLVLDEQQDMNPIIYNFVLKLLRDSAKTGTNSPQLVLLGDPRQEIYQFNNADKRFLTHCRYLFPGQYMDKGKVHDRTWVEINQTVSFRMSTQIVKFINNQMLRGSKPPIQAKTNNPNDPLPRYVVCDAYGEGPLKELRRLLKILPPEQILILAPSLRSLKCPIRELANRVTLEIPECFIHVSVNDDDRVSEKVSKGKLLFTSYHQAKGIEREAVILFDFSSSYYDFYDKHPETLLNVGNVQYVAATRAKKHLIMIHHFEDDYLPFIDQKTLLKYCEVPPGPMVRPVRTEQQLRQIMTPKSRWKVTALTRNIPETVLSSCFEELDLAMVYEPRTYRPWPKTEIFTQYGFWEEVADITGTAVPAIYEYLQRGTCKLVVDVMASLHKSEEPLGKLDEKYINRILEANEKLEQQKLEISDILFIANISNMLRSKYLFKVYQIPIEEYTWFTKAATDTTILMLDNALSPEAARYEIFIGHQFHDVMAGENAVLVTGRVDVFDYSRLWELKWTSALRPEHVLQTALYGAINKRTKIKKFHEEEFWDGQPLVVVQADAKRKTRKRIKIDIDYHDSSDEGLQKKLSRISNYLLHVPTGQKVRVSPILRGKRDGFIEVLRKLVNAKINPPPLAISNKKFLAEAKLGFPSIVGKCTVPAWLGRASGGRHLEEEVEEHAQD
ncbi:hypothetical protein DRE_03515 [Drechslerella stenobrocha 248]|uniref:UvrD-like helicase C-terminal domain-containing protein n=1 Tax=Drechslerella stenobrocha 248 TaxID=1043628 RepID=W7HSU4_9PEZI|nr:hypothetical protein DRE_03515 [Drechslerella stenobrocha 248]